MLPKTCEIHNSPKFQNQVVTCIGDYIRNNIISYVSRFSFFIITADETTDVSVIEQMRICVSYVNDTTKEILEDFIGFVELPNTNAETITEENDRKFKTN